jgi:transaldolase/glucose-6-phosphate isomerase
MISSAAAILRPVYDKTAGADGYVSLEVNPPGSDTDGTIAEAHRLSKPSTGPMLMISACDHARHAPNPKPDRRWININVR